MGIRIHRAIGWGMTMEAFEVLRTRPDEDDDGLYSIFNRADDDFLTVKTKEDRGFGDGDRGGVIIEPRLLATSYTDGNRRPAEIGPASDLYDEIGYDDPSHVLFYPSLSYRSNWRKYDDDVDYAFEANRHLFDESSPTAEQRDPRNIVEFTKFGHYPYTNALMDKVTGAHIDWEHYTLLERRTDWAPAVPREIRWYLKRLDLLDDNGINQLRPMIAQWWS